MRGWIPKTLFCVALLTVSILAFAEAEDQVTSYDGTIQQYLVDAGGTVTKRDVEARLDVTKADKDPGDPKLTFWAREDPDSVAFLVTPESLPDAYRSLLPEDQSRLFVYGYYTKAENGLLELPLHIGDTALKAWRTVTMFGADERPLAGYKVALSVYRRASSGASALPVVILEDLHTAADGTVSYPVPVAAAGPRGIVQHYVGSSRSVFEAEFHSLAVIDPMLGQSVSARNTLNSPRLCDLETPNQWYLPFIEEKDVGATLMFRGRVIDSAGDPAAGALLSSVVALYPDGQKHHINLGEGLKVSDDGRFAFTINRYWLMKKLRRPDLPPGTTMTLWVEPPEGRKLELRAVHRSGVTLRTDQENTIVMQKGAQITVKLADEDGNPLVDAEVMKTANSRGALLRPDHPAASGEPSEGYALRRISQPGETPIRFQSLEVLPLPNEYRFHLGQFEFLPREIAAADARNPVVVRRRNGRSTFTGRVLDTRDGSPLAGAYVVMAHAGFVFMHQSLPDPDRLTALFQDVPEGGFINRTFESDEGSGDPKNLMSSHIMALGRTDANGQYRLVGTPGAQATVIAVYTPGFLPAHSSVDRVGIAGSVLQEIEFPDAALVPAAIAEVTALLPENLAAAHKRAYWASFTVSYDPNPEWIPRARRPNDSGYDDDVWEDELKVYTNVGFEDTVATVPIPADARFAVTAHPTGWSEDLKGLCPAQWKVADPVAPGETAILEMKEFPQCKWLDVFVQYPDGTPAANFTIRSRSMRVGSLTTDSNGSAGAYIEDSVLKDLRINDGSGTAVLQQEDVSLTRNGEKYELHLTLPEKVI